MIELEAALHFNKYSGYLGMAWAGAPWFDVSFFNGPCSKDFKLLCFGIAFTIAIESRIIKKSNI